MIKIHKLKTWPVYFEAALSGEKNFEFRHNDRNFKVGDYLLLYEFTPHGPGLTGRMIIQEITFILLASDTIEFPMAPDWCIMGTRVPRHSEVEK